MKIRIVTIMSVLIATALLVGCATIAQKATETTGIGVSAGLNQLTIRAEDGTSIPELSPGESVVLVAKGYDENAREITAANVTGTKINPTWSVSDSDIGSVDPKQGKQTTFTLSEDASGITTSVTAKQDDIEGIILISIK
jgi:uncharacterized protein YceK